MTNCEANVNMHKYTNVCFMHHVYVWAITYCIDALQVRELHGVFPLLLGAHLLELLHAPLVLLRQVLEGGHAALEGPEQDGCVKRLDLAVAQGAQSSVGIQLCQLLHILVQREGLLYAVK